MKWVIAGLSIIATGLLLSEGFKFSNWLHGKLGQRHEDRDHAMDLIKQANQRLRRAE